MNNPDSQNATLSVEALERINGIRRRFEEALKRGERPRIEDDLGDATGPERRYLLRELLLLELDYRHKNGEAPSTAEYLARFPSEVELIHSVFAVPSGAPRESTLNSPSNWASQYLDTLAEASQPADLPQRGVST